MRKVIFVLLIFLMLYADAYAMMAVNTEEGSFLLDNNGGVVIPAGVYTDIVCLGFDHTAVQKDGLYALADQDGAVLTDYIYTDIMIDHDTVCAGTDGRYKILDSAGREFAGGIYSRIVISEKGRAWALKSDEDQLFLLSPGRAAYAPLPEVFEIADTCGCGLLAYRSSDSMLWGYCDENGRRVIEDRFSAAEPFSQGLAVTVLDGYYGVIKTDGSEMIPFEYDRIEMSDTLIAAEKKEHMVSVFRKDGNAVGIYENVTGGYALQGDRYALFYEDHICLYDENGDAIARLAPNASLNAGIDGGIIVSEGIWGEKCVRLYGAQMDPVQDITPLGRSQGKPVYRSCEFDISVVKDGSSGEDYITADLSTMRCAVLSSEGKLLTGYNWESITYLQDDRFLAETEERWQVIDANGKTYYTIKKSK